MLAAKNRSRLRLSRYFIAFAIATTVMVGCAAHPTCKATSNADLQRLAEQRNLQCWLEVHGTSLTSLDAAAGLQTVQGISLNESPELNDVDLIATLIGPFEFAAESVPLAPRLVLPGMVSRARLYWISADTVELDASFSGSLVIQGAANLARIEGPQTRALESIEIVDTPDLARLADGLPALEECRGLTVQNAPQVAAQEIASVASRCGLGMDEVVHCGNLDDAPCSATPG